MNDTGKVLQKQREKNIDISIVIPVYNVDMFIEQCIKSIIAQDYPSHRYEIIFVNDCSTDDSINIVNRYKTKYKNMIVVEHQNNRGLSAARNTGLEVARGKYIWFVDSDDFIAKDALSKLYELAEKKDVDGILFDCKRQIEGEEAKKRFSRYIVKDNPFPQKRILTGKEIFKGFNEIKNYKIEAWRYFWRLDFLRKKNIKFYEGLWGEDNLFGFIALMETDKIIYLKEDFYIYRLRDGSLMYRKDQMKLHSMIVILTNILEYWRKHEEINVLEKEISDYLYQFIDIFYDQCNQFSLYEKMIMGDKVDSWIYNFFLKTQCWRQQIAINNDSQVEKALLSQENIYYIEAAKRVIVYGAGKYGHKVIRQLSENNIHIDAVAVSKKEADYEIVGGYMVYQIDTLVSWNKDAVIILAVGKKNLLEMKENLDRLGFKNVVYVC